MSGKAEQMSWLMPEARPRTGPAFNPRVTAKPSGEVRIRETVTVRAFDATVARADIPRHRHDRQQWVIELCRAWYEHVHWGNRLTGIPYEPFGTEHLALATRFADAVEPHLRKLIDDAEESQE